MPLLLIEVPNEAAVAELRQNPNLRVVGVVTEEAMPPTAPKPRSWAGLLPPESGERMLREVAELRQEWERNS